MTLEEYDYIPGRYAGWDVGPEIFDVSIEYRGFFGRKDRAVTRKERDSEFQNLEREYLGFEEEFE